jgi:hypothetical protein
MSGRLRSLPAVMEPQAQEEVSTSESPIIRLALALHENHKQRSNTGHTGDPLNFKFQTPPDVSVSEERDSRGSRGQKLPLPPVDESCQLPGSVPGSQLSAGQLKSRTHSRGGTDPAAAAACMTAAVAATASATNSLAQVPDFFDEDFDIWPMDPATIKAKKYTEARGDSYEKALLSVQAM